MQKYLKQQQLLYIYKSFFKKHSWLSFFLLFLISFGFLFWIQNTKTFADPDSFYHAKIIWMMKEKIINGELPIFNEFPWLYYTVLKANYIDHHFLYHLLSIPFLYFTSLIQYLIGNQNFEPILISFKLATISFASIFVVTFYFILKKLKINGAIFYTFLLLITNPFLFRLSLGKTTAISLIFIWLGIYFLFKIKNSISQKKQKIALFFLSFFYVWLYGGWPLMLVVVAIFILTDAFVNCLIQKRIKIFINTIFSKSNIKLFIIVAGGLISGLIINPYFPKNIIFYYHQIYQIAIINYQDILNVGAEWYPYNFFELLTVSSPVFALTIPALIFFIGNIIHFCKNKTKYSDDTKNQIFTLIFSFLLAIIFLALTLRARRNVEYLFPFLTFFVASSLTLTIKNFYKPNSWKKITNLIIKKWLISGLLLGFVFTTFPYIIWRDVYSVKQESINGFSWNTWQNASTWLKNNTEQGDIIFHNDWDDWPFLFFHNEKNYYIVGLDPTFMYKYDTNLYQKWSDATIGYNTELTILTKKLNSQYILVDSDHNAFENQIINTGNFKKVFSDEKTKIYKLNK